MKHEMAFLALGLAIGLGASELVRSHSADAQSAATGGAWQLGVNMSGSFPGAWKLNTGTGELQCCTYAGQSPQGQWKCFAMAKPSN
jgi:hypothetical protein